MRESRRPARFPAAPSCYLGKFSRKDGLEGESDPDLPRYLLPLTIDTLVTTSTTAFRDFSILTSKGHSR